MTSRRPSPSKSSRPCPLPYTAFETVMASKRRRVQTKSPDQNGYDIICYGLEGRKGFRVVTCDNVDLFKQRHFFLTGVSLDLYLWMPDCGYVIDQVYKILREHCKDLGGGWYDCDRMLTIVAAIDKAVRDDALDASASSPSPPTKDGGSIRANRATNHKGHSPGSASAPDRHG